MRINILQHTPNEGPGAIKEWAKFHNHEVYTYHPYQFGVLPNANETDFLIILGGPMSPNDDLDWIIKERELINQLIKQGSPIFGACYGAQQIAKALGYKISKAPHKEVGWAPVYLRSAEVPGIPKMLTALHWHEEMFEIPAEAKLLFSSDLVENQGFIIGNKIIGLQFHFEPQQNDIYEIAVNDFAYPTENNALNQNATDIMKRTLPQENKEIMFKLLDYISK